MSLVRNKKLAAKVCLNNLKAASGRSDLLRHSVSKKHLEAQNDPLFNSKQFRLFLLIPNWSQKKLKSKFLCFCPNTALHFYPWTINKIDEKLFFWFISDAKSFIRKNETDQNNKQRCWKRTTKYRLWIFTKNKFSISIDESAHVNNLKNVCIVAGLSIDCDVKDLFFGLINVTQCDAQSLHKVSNKLYGHHDRICCWCYK